MRASCDLWKMRDTQYLPLRAQCTQFLAHDFSDTATNAAVDFIEYQCRDGIAAGRDHLDGQADA